MPLEDGTNAENEDLAELLPFKSKEEIKDLLLYGTHASPATCKTRALFNLARIGYTKRFGKLKTSSYQKFPVVTFNETQINDSHIIFKNMAPILFEGYKLTDEDVELEKLTTFGLMLACEAQAFSDAECMKQWTRTAGITGVSGWMVRNLAPLSMFKKGAEKIAESCPDLKTPLEYCKEIKEALVKRGTTYFGGNSIGPLDASIYGAIAAWAPGGDNTMPFMDLALNDSGLFVWYEAVDSQIPNMWEIEGRFPFYT